VNTDQKITHVLKRVDRKYNPDAEYRFTIDELVTVLEEMFDTGELDVVPVK